MHKSNKSEKVEEFLRFKIEFIAYPFLWINADAATVILK